MKIKTNTILRISCVYGSSFQKEFGEETLVSAVTAWKSYLNSSHKGNKIKVEIILATIDK